MTELKGSQFKTHQWARPGWALETQPRYEAPGNLQVGHAECVPLTISYHLYFFCISKVMSSYITGQWGKLTVKNDTSCFYIYFLDIFCCFSSKKIVLSFSVFFLGDVSNFHNNY